MGCGATSRSPEQEQMWNTIIEAFDKIPEPAQPAFLSTFRPAAEDSARETLSGSELSEQLEFIAELDSELRKRKK